MQPIRYAYEAILTNEFHTLQGSCSTLIPSGVGYEGISIQNQACPVVGATPGQPYVDGNRYVDLSYEYSYSHTWRNFGILVGFFSFFLFTYLSFTEITSGAAEFRSVVTFKRGSKNAPKFATSPRDVESNHGGGSSNNATATQTGETEEEHVQQAEDPLEKTLRTTDIMSWVHLTYHVSVGGGETKRLLNDISGWVVPGKLTALMGESGAGKVSPLSLVYFPSLTLPDDFRPRCSTCSLIEPMSE